MPLTLHLLTFVKSGERYSTYLDEHGDEIYFANGRVMTRMVEIDQLHNLWEQFVADGNLDGNGCYLSDQEWLDETRELLLNPEVEVHWCPDCGELLIESIDTHHEVERDGKTVCRSCFGTYRECDNCEIAFESDDMTYTHDERWVCERCLDRLYHYCDTCESYYHHDEGHAHGCECESPEQSFAMPLLDGKLTNDDRVEVSLPAGTISDEGMQAIRHLIHDAAYRCEEYAERCSLNAVARFVHEIGIEWQTRKGNFTKRLSRLTYNTNGYKISADLLARIGSTAREHSSECTALEVEITRDLNQSPEDFGNEGSCWWESYASSRCALKSNGGFGLRSFGGSWNEVSGRVWVMPIKVKDDTPTPTFDSLTADAFLVFNGYGDLSGYTGPRMVAHMTGMTYRKINFTSSPMYVNGDTGYLVAPEEIAQKLTYVNFYLDEHSSLHLDEISTNNTEVSNVA